MSESRYVECRHCGADVEIDTFSVEVGRGFGLVGISCSNCPEMIPAEDINDVFPDPIE